MTYDVIMRFGGMIWSITHADSKEEAEIIKTQKEKEASDPIWFGHATVSIEPANK